MLKATVFVALVVAAASIAPGPAHAGASASLSGEVECSTPGTYSVTWTIENLTQNENSTGLGGGVVRAELSGATDGDIVGSFAPNPFNFDDRFIVGSNTLAGDAVGELTLDVEILFTVNGPFDFSFETATSVELDGSCTEPTSTTTTSATSPLVAARLTFTG